MRTRIALALALCAAAAPLHAQKADSVYHGPGYELVLPARYEFVNAMDRDGDGYRMRIYVFGNDGGGVLVLRLEPRRQLADTTLSTRRAALQLVRAGMMQAAGKMRLDGEPTEILRDDRLTLRANVVMGDGATAGTRTILDTSVSRRGPIVVWMVVAVREHPDARDEAIGRRVLDSFSLTVDTDPMVDASARTGDLDAKP